MVALYYVHACMCVRVRVCVHVHVCVCMCARVCARACVYVWVWVCLSVCVPVLVIRVDCSWLVLSTKQLTWRCQCNYNSLHHCSICQMCSQPLISVDLMPVCSLLMPSVTPLSSLPSPPLPLFVGGASESSQDLLPTLDSCEL